MVKLHKQSPSPTKKPYRGEHSHKFVADLQVIQYRSYQRTVSIYHVRTHLLPLRLIRNAMQSQQIYVDKLTSFDPLHNMEVTEGDEPPSECVEAAYLPSILHGHGSALALRTAQEPERVEWFIFSGPIHDNLLSLLICTDGSWTLPSTTGLDDSTKIFDVVGYVEKGLATRTVRGANREHKGWHQSLCAAEEGKKRLKLIWKGFGADLSADQHMRRLKRMKDNGEDHGENSGGLTSMEEPKYLSMQDERDDWKREAHDQ